MKASSEEMGREEDRTVGEEEGDREVRFSERRTAGDDDWVSEEAGGAKM